MDWPKRLKLILEIARTLCHQRGENYSDAWFARLVNVSPQVLSGWVKGRKPNMDDLRSIGKELGLSATWLLYGEGDPRGEMGPPSDRPEPPSPAATRPIPAPITKLDADIAAIRRHMKELDATKAETRDAIREYLGGGARKDKGGLTRYPVAESASQYLRAAEKPGEYGAGSGDERE